MKISGGGYGNFTLPFGGGEARYLKDSGYLSGATYMGPSGRRFVASEESGESRSRLISLPVDHQRVDRQSRKGGSRVLTRPPKQVSDEEPDSSSNGERIVFSRADIRGDTSEIYVVKARGKETKRLTRARKRGTQSFSPSFSPDGSQIAFISFSRRKPERRVIIMDSDGRHVRRVSHDGDCRSVVFSPDGTQLAASCSRGIRIYEVNGSGKHLISGSPSTEDLSWVSR